MKSFISILSIIIGIITLLGVSFFMFAPEERVLAAKSEWKRLLNDPEQVCFDIWSGDLKDKKSALIEKSGIIDGKLKVIYSAKNSFGAYRRGVFECHMKDGKVDKHKTTMEKLDKTIEALKEYAK